MSGIVGGNREWNFCDIHIWFNRCPFKKKAVGAFKNVLEHFELFLDQKRIVKRQLGQLALGSLSSISNTGLRKCWVSSDWNTTISYDLAAPAVPLRIVGEVNFILVAVHVVNVKLVFPLIGYPAI